MFNLLNGEFYKLLKRKSFYVCCIVIVAYCIFMTVTQKLIDKYEQENSSQQTGIQIETESTDMADEIGIMDMEEQAVGSFFAVTAAIFASIFVIGEYGNGAIKNITGKGYSRTKVYLAKYLSTIVAVTIMFFVTVIAALLCAVVGLKSEINMDIIKNLCQYGAIQLLLTIALTGIFNMIGEISRGMGAGVSINLAVVMFSSLIFSWLDVMLRYLNVDFETSKYWITKLISDCPLVGIDNRFVLLVIGSVVFWTAAALLMGILHFKKADVK